MENNLRKRILKLQTCLARCFKCLGHNLVDILRRHTFHRWCVLQRRFFWHLTFLIDNLDWLPLVEYECDRMSIGKNPSAAPLIHKPGWMHLESDKHYTEMMWTEGVTAVKTGLRRALEIECYKNDSIWFVTTVSLLWELTLRDGRSGMCF